MTYFVLVYFEWNGWFWAEKARLVVRDENRAYRSRVRAFRRLSRWIRAPLAWARRSRELRGKTAPLNNNQKVFHCFKISSLEALEALYFERIHSTEILKILDLIDAELSTSIGHNTAEIQSGARVSRWVQELSHDRVARTHVDHATSWRMLHDRLQLLFVYTEWQS